MTTDVFVLYSLTQLTYDTQPTYILNLTLHGFVQLFHHSMQYYYSLKITELAADSDCRTNSLRSYQATSRRVIRVCHGVDSRGLTWSYRICKKYRRTAIPKFHESRRPCPSRMNLERLHFFLELSPGSINSGCHIPSGGLGLAVLSFEILLNLSAFMLSFQASAFHGLAYRSLSPLYFKFVLVKQKPRSSNCHRGEAFRRPDKVPL